MDQIIDLALSYNFWVFGGWIRDVVLTGRKPRDVDIMVPKSQAGRAGHFLQVLGAVRQEEVRIDRELKGYFTTTSAITKVWKLYLGNGLHADLAFYDGELEDWKSDYTCDLSCNLFYMTREVPMGIRYIPWQMRHMLNPMKHLISMTKRGEFCVIHEPTDEPGEEKRIKHVMRRAFGMVSRDWAMAPDFIPSDIWEACQDIEGLNTWLREMEAECIETERDCKVKALERTTRLPARVLDEVRRNLDFNVV
jgi:hypothetical protein